MPSYRVLIRQEPWRRFLVASTSSRLPVTMGVFGMVLAGRAAGSFALGARLAALYTITGAGTAVWRGRRLDRGDLRVGVRRHGFFIATVTAVLTLCVYLHAPWPVLACGAVALGAAIAVVPAAYRALLPAVVLPEQVGAAYALDSVCVEACFVLGPAVAAVAAWFAGAGAVFAVMAACSLVGSVAARRLPAIHRRASPGVAADPPHRLPVVIGSLAGAVAAGTVLGAFDATFPALAVALGTRAAAGGGLITLTAVGSATAGFLLGARIAAAHDVAWRGSQVLMVFGVAVLPLCVVPSLAGVAAVALLAGAPFALLATGASVLVQRQVDPSRTTEAFSLLYAGLLGGSAAGSAAASAVLGPLGPRDALAIAAAAPVAVGTVLVIVIARRRQRQRGAPVVLPAGRGRDRAAPVLNPAVGWTPVVPGPQPGQRPAHRSSRPGDAAV